MTLTLVLRGGLVYDGLGNPPVQTDVGLTGDRIAVVGDVPVSDVPSLDLSGLAVAPGFINVLSHAWQAIQVDSSCQSDLVQGVTTEVFGEAESLGPTNEALVQLMRDSGSRPGARLDFARLGDGLDHVIAGGSSVNVASFLGGSNLRALGAGLDDRPLSESELDLLCGIVDEEIADGALGIGTALIYAPGSYATTDELVRLCEVVGRHDGLYISHLRSEGDQFLECLEELLTIGQRAGCRVHNYHLKAGGSHNHHKMALAVERIERARAEGQVVTADMYPYTAGATALAAAIPPKYHAGGIAVLLERLGDPRESRRIAQEITAPDGDFENLFLGAAEGAGVLVLQDMSDGTPTSGRYLSELAGNAPLADTLLDLVRRDPTLLACYFLMSEANVQLGLAQPWVSICSDAEAIGPGTMTSDSAHPRTFGSFARVLGHYARDEGLFSVEEAIRKMTSLAADTLQLKDRGRLVPGAFADLVVFDPAEVHDPATYENPKQYATGVRHVLVNGVPVLADGEVLPARPGRRLRRGT